MTSIDNSKFYQFIAKIQDETGKTWAEHVDSRGNGDGVVTKNEFIDFMRAEFEWAGVNKEAEKDDIITKFWGEMDTNTRGKLNQWVDNLNALDKNELGNIETKIATYKILDEYIARNVLLDDETGKYLGKYKAQWKSDVTDELIKVAEKLIADGCTNLEDELGKVLNSIKNTNLAEYCAIVCQEKLKDTLKDYPNYKVADDETLQNLLSTYAKNVGAEVTEADIIAYVESIVKEYFATAGIGESEDASILTGLGYDASKLNDLQIEVIRQKITDDLKDEVESYKDKGYEKEYNEAVKKFIEAKLAEGKSFNDLMNAASEFADSEFKTSLDNMITVMDSYADIEVDSNFHYALKEAFGDKIADRIVNNERYIKAYKDIIADVIEKVKSGELAMEEVENYIIEQITANIEKFITNDLSEMSLEELYSTYEKLAAGAEAQEDDNKALKQHREAAIKYCEALIKKSNVFEEAVKEVFGDDWKSQIGKLLPSEIKALIEELKLKAEELKDKAEEVKESINYTVAGWETNLEDSFNLSPNETLKNKKITANITDGNGKAIEANRIDYEPKISGGGSATIDTLGYLNITAPSNSGYMTIKVYARVDGIVVGEPKVITITCDDTYSKEKIEEKDEAELATLSNWVSCGWANKSGAKSPGDAIAEAKTTIENQVNSIVTMLNSKGYSMGKLIDTRITLLNYYNKLLDQVKDPDNDYHKGGTNRTASFQYEDANGVKHQASAQYTHEARADHTKMSAKPSTDSGILLQEDTSGKNDYRVIINMQVVAQKFIEIFNSL